MVKIKNQKPNDINILNMKDGDIAEITYWGCREHEGRVVQRYEDNLIIVGEGRERGWPNYFDDFKTTSNRVRILEKGEELIID